MSFLVNESGWLRTIAVFGGSRGGNDPAYGALAFETCKSLAGANFDMIYGGGNAGLMGKAARGARAAGGNVVGVTLPFLDAAQGHSPDGIDTIIMNNMHERQTAMIEWSEAALFFPGGFGMFEEAFDLLVRNDLSNISSGGKPSLVRPAVFLNHNGFFDPLNAMIDKSIAEGFIPAERKKFVHFTKDLQETVSLFKTLNKAAPMSSAPLCSTF